MLKSLGVRVNAMEVVDTLMASELLADAGVYGVDHELFGHQICAAVVLRPGATLAEVRKYCRTAMSEYMLPRRITAYDVLPKTRTGKVDIEALKKSST